MKRMLEGLFNALDVVSTIPHIISYDFDWKPDKSIAVQYGLSVLAGLFIIGVSLSILLLTITTVVALFIYLTIPMLIVTSIFAFAILMGFARKRMERSKVENEANPFPDKKSKKGY